MPRIRHSEAEVELSKTSISIVARSEYLPSVTLMAPIFPKIKGPDPWW